MGRFCHGLLTGFRVIQLILSIAALGFGIFIAYTMFSMADSAQNIEQGLGVLVNTTSPSDSDFEALNMVDKAFTPVLQNMEETPTRAIVLSAVALWSVCVIAYLLHAQRRSRTRPTRLNKRSIRITLEIFTFIFWLGALVCAAMLAIEYGGIALFGGAEARGAYIGIKPLLKDALERTFKDKDDDSIMRSLDIVNDICTIGILSILAVISAAVCGMVSLVSCFVACCYSGKAKNKSDTINDQEHLDSGMVQQYTPYAPVMTTDKYIPAISVAETYSPNSRYTPTTPVTPAYPYLGYDNGGNHRHY